jgi:hypothetical protein
VDFDRGEEPPVGHVFDDRVVVVATVWDPFTEKCKAILAGPALPEVAEGAIPLHYTCLDDLMGELMEKEEVPPASTGYPTQPYAVITLDQVTMEKGLEIANFSPNAPPEVMGYSGVGVTLKGSLVLTTKGAKGVLRPGHKVIVVAIPGD